MKTFILVSCLFAGLSLAADANSVNNLIKTIANYTILLNNDVSDFNGGIAGLPYALQVQQDAVNLHKQVGLGTAEAKASPAFGQPGSQQVSVSLVNLSNNVTTALDKTASKSATFSDLGPIVLASLLHLKMDTNQFSDALVPKLSSAEQAAAPAIINRINSAFDRAIKAYGG